MLINDNASTDTATSTNDAPKPEQVNSTSAVTKESAVRLIENLVNERQQWQEAVYKTSNDMLYGLLQRCYGLYSTMCEKSNDGKAAREGFALYLERNKLAFKKGTAFQFDVTDKGKVFTVATDGTQILFDGKSLFYSRPSNRHEDHLLLDRSILLQYQSSDALVHLASAVLRSLPELGAPQLSFINQQFCLAIKTERRNC